jgi:hypothetical protein
MTRPSRRAVVRTGVWKVPVSTGEDHELVEGPSADSAGQLEVTAAALARMVRRDG